MDSCKACNSVAAARLSSRTSRSRLRSAATRPRSRSAFAAKRSASRWSSEPCCSLWSRGVRCSLWSRGVRCWALLCRLPSSVVRPPCFGSLRDCSTRPSFFARCAGRWFTRSNSNSSTEISSSTTAWQSIAGSSSANVLQLGSCSCDSTDSGALSVSSVRTAAADSFVSSANFALAVALGTSSAPGAPPSCRATLAEDLPLADHSRFFAGRCSASRALASKAALSLSGSSEGSKGWDIWPTWPARDPSCVRRGKAPGWGSFFLWRETLCAERARAFVHLW
mmetsp:Transcript_125705/g.367266  ORF Transcript_125705/g.367266 Transcript_125705/m.367266 type:complete len:280 (+) Transcript_125705:1434-2273(+)